MLALSSLLAACSMTTSSSSTTIGSSAGATVGVSTPTPPAGDPHAGHAGHDMSGLPPVVIPTGVLYTEADVRFMQGMIAHHAQAMHMSKMAESRGASPRLVRFAQKIDQSQTTEIVQMQQWLHAKKQFAPDTSSWRTMTMPGMLTTAELATLDSARGKEFERLFLQLMIRHHEGAIMMVDDLLKTPRAGQEVNINVFANEVVAVQQAEIEAMHQMLSEL
jgi:uncharacterized protein (DUF305 family)